MAIMTNFVEESMIFKKLASHNFDILIMRHCTICYLRFYSILGPSDLKQPFPSLVYRSIKTHLLIAVALKATVTGWGTTKASFWISDDILLVVAALPLRRPEMTLIRKRKRSTMRGTNASEWASLLHSSDHFNGRPLNHIYLINSDTYWQASTRTVINCPVSQLFYLFMLDCI